MKILTREELKTKLDNGDNFKLIMAMDQYAFDLMHIPGSLHYDRIQDAAENLSPDEEIVVYCSNVLCQASVRAYLYLRSMGFRNIYRYAGGLIEWQEAGYPLEGSMAAPSMEMRLA